MTTVDDVIAAKRRRWQGGDTTEAEEKTGCTAEEIYEETFISDPGGAVIPAPLSHAGCFLWVYESSSPFLGMSCFNNSNAFLIPASESLPGSIGMCARQQARR